MYEGLVTLSCPIEKKFFLRGLELCLLSSQQPLLSGENPVARRSVRRGLFLPRYGLHQTRLIQCDYITLDPCDQTKDRR